MSRWHILLFLEKCGFTRRIGSRSLKIEPMLPSLMHSIDIRLTYHYSISMSV
jgi:hypothetical protein